MENNLHVIDRRIKITEEVKEIDLPQLHGVNGVNGGKAEVGKGNQHILRICLIGNPIAQLTFFSPINILPEELNELREGQVVLLCDSLVKPLSAFVKQIKYHAAIKS